jgi:hypothetical protein
MVSSEGSQRSRIGRDQTLKEAKKTTPEHDPNDRVDL